MSSMLGPAKLFFEACESGEGWDGCRIYCHPGATFSAQSETLVGVSTVEAYCDWMKSLFTPVPDGHYELKFFAADESTNSIAAFAVFHGTQTGPGGPVAPTGKKVASDYVYHMVFDDGRIQHVTKIWNDNIALQQLNWA